MCLPTGAAHTVYAVRPLALPGCEVGACNGYGGQGSLRLAGYGVELALKNMEYKAMDEKVQTRFKSCFSGAQL